MPGPLGFTIMNGCSVDHSPFAFLHPRANSITRRINNGQMEKGTSSTMR